MSSTLNPMDLVCLAGVVIFAFHFAGSVGRRPGRGEAATWEHLREELNLPDASLDLLHNEEELKTLKETENEYWEHQPRTAPYLRKTNAYDDGSKRDVASRSPKRLLQRVKEDPAKLREDFFKYRGWSEKDVDKLLHKLAQLEEDEHKMESSTAMGSAFYRFDTNRDGKIEPDELKTVLQAVDQSVWTDMRMSMLFSAMDVNADGRIDYGEFIEFIFYSGSSTGFYTAEKSLLDSESVNVEKMKQELVSARKLLTESLDGFCTQLQTSFEHLCGAMTHRLRIKCFCQTLRAKENDPAERTLEHGRPGRLAYAIEAGRCFAHSYYEEEMGIERKLRGERSKFNRLLREASDVCQTVHTTLSREFNEAKSSLEGKAETEEALIEEGRRFELTLVEKKTIAQEKIAKLLTDAENALSSYGLLISELKQKDVTSICNIAHDAIAEASAKPLTIEIDGPVSVHNSIKPPVETRGHGKVKDRLFKIDADTGEYVRSVSHHPACKLSTATVTLEGVFVR